MNDSMMSNITLIFHTSYFSIVWGNTSPLGKEKKMNWLSAIEDFEFPWEGRKAGFILSAEMEI